MGSESVSDSTYRDASGKRLSDYPRPSLAADTAVLTVPPSGRLSVLLVRPEAGIAGGEWMLPGGFVHERERLADAVLRTLWQKATVSGAAPQLLAVFDEPDRDERGWVISVAHVSALRWGSLEEAVESRPDLQVRPVDEARGLPFDHDAIVLRARDQLKFEYNERPDPRALLPEPFTLLELQRLHEAVAGTRVVKDTFRRSMTPYLRETGQVRSGVVGKPARLFAVL